MVIHITYCDIGHADTSTLTLNCMAW